MRSSISARLNKAVSLFFAATLCCGLIPTAAFAAPDSLSLIPEGEQGAAPIVSGAEGGQADVLALRSDDSAPSVDGGGAASTSEDVENINDDGEAAVIPAATQRINEDMTLTTRTVAQAESTRSYFLAQTLESTRTVPIVSANLPLDTGSTDVTEPESEGSSSQEEEGDDGDDDPDADDPVDASFTLTSHENDSAVSAESTVVGSFTYRGITYAVEPGGESVAVVVADYAKLPEEFIENQVIVLPSMVTDDGLNLYSVTRIVDHAFSSITAAAASENSGDADASSDIQAEAEASAYGITAVAIPASITEIGDDAFAGFDTLQYIIVSEDNPNYSMYDGALYDADLATLLYVPEGRTGALYIAPDLTGIDLEVFSKSVIDTIIADPDSAAFQLLSENDDYKNKEDSTCALVSTEYEYSDLYVVPGHIQELIEVGEQENQQTNAAEIEIDTRLSELSSAEMRNKLVQMGFTIIRAKTLPSNFNSNTCGAVSGKRYMLALTSPDYDLVVQNFAGASWIVPDKYIDLTTVAGDYSKPHISRTYYGGGEFMGESGSSETFTNRILYSETRGFYVQSLKPGVEDSCYALRERRTGRLIKCREVAYSTGNVRLSDGTVLSRVHVLLPPPYDIEACYEGEWTDADETVVSGTWTAKKQTATLNTKVSYERYETGVEEPAGEQEVGIGDPNNNYYYLPIPTNIQPSNYIFIGWSTNPSAKASDTSDWFYRADGRYADSWSRYITAPIKLYAIYSPGHNITLNDMITTTVAGDGSFPALNENLKVKEKVTPPQSDGYAFNGYYEIIDGVKRFWYDSNGDLIEEGSGEAYTFSEAKHAYPLTTGYDLYADWVRDVTLDTQIGTTPAVDQKIHVTWKDDLPTTAIAGVDACSSENGPVNHARTSIVKPERDGYEFNGYWSTSYDESHPENDLYYEEKNGSVVPVEGKTWDISQDTQDRLYAHWKYKVYLNLNTFNSDGEIVLNDAQNAFGAAAPTLAATDEQTALGADGSFNYTGSAAVPVQGGNGTAQNVSVQRYSFTAIYGAPIKLPEVTGRTGYGSTSSWATTPGSCGIIPAPAEGAADPRISYADATTRTTAAYPFGQGGDSLAAQIPDYETGITLYANWDGLANKYTVNLVSQYTYTDGSTSVVFNNTGANTESNPVAIANVTYDQPLFKLDTEGNAVPTGATDPKAAPVFNNTGSTDKDLVFLGFYTAKNNAYSASSSEYNTTQGKKYAGSYAAEMGGAKSVVSATEQVNGTTRAVAFREAPSSGTTVTLYALWGWPQVKLTFDLQGGTIDGSSANKEFVVTTNDAMPSAMSIGTPVRAGYEFAGFWLGERYNEGSAAATKQYYTANMATANSHTTWTYTDGGTLYAHWKYRIAFDKNLTDGDKAQMNLDYADPETYRVNVAMALAADGAPVTDAYGNEYTLVNDANGTSKVEITAIAGAPVQLRAVHSRTRADNTPTGYNPTITFTADAANAKALTIDKDATAGYYLKPAWGSDGAKTALATAFNSAPIDSVRVNGADVNRVTVYADWTGAAQKFWVKVMPSYSFNYEDANDDGQQVKEAYAYTAYTEVTDSNGNVTAKPAFTPSQPYMLVTYDGTVPTLATNQFTDRARATVTPDGGTATEHDNLELLGFYSQPNSLYNSATSGVKHLNAQGAHDTSCQAKFREYLLTALYVESRDGVNATKPASSVTDSQIIPLYARWAQPTSAVVFNYFDARTTADSSKSSDEEHAASQQFSLQKGDKLAVKATENSDRLRNIAATVKTVTNLREENGTKRYDTYEFGGFWTHPYYEGDYTEGAATRTSKKYFDLSADRSTLVPTQTTWQEDTSVPLYAHWKFTVTYLPNPKDPLPAEKRAAATAWQGANDMLWFAADGSSMATDSKNAVPFGNGAQVVYGQTIQLAKDAASIVRTRDYGTAGAPSIQRAGYTFAGWHTASDCTADNAVIYQTAATGTVSTCDLVPQAKGAASLYANWTQDVYDIVLLPTYDGFYYGTDDYVRELTNRTEFNTTSTVSVRFDEPLSESIVPPNLRGFTFLGFYSTGEGAAPAFKNDAAHTYDFTAGDAMRLKFYGNTVANGKVSPEGTRWTVRLDGTPNANGRQSSQIYAHYSLNECQITFSLDRDANEAVDSTQQATPGNGFTSAATWYYGKKLATEIFPSTTTFSRYGYKFAGWYYFADDATGFTERDRTYIYKCDETVPAAVYQWNGTSWARPVSGSDRWYEEGDKTLHAAWTPIAYTVNFYYNSPVSGGSATPDDTMTLTYGQQVQRASAVNTHENGRIPNPAASPFRFAGWRTAKTMTAPGFWLVNGKDANGSNESDRIKESGVFMPKAGEVKGADTDRPWIDYYAQWHDLEDSYLVFFSGNHGALENGYDANGNELNSGSTAKAVASDTLLKFGGSYNLNNIAHVNPDGGWRHLGWVELDASEIPELAADAGDPAKALVEQHGDALADINGTEMTGKQTDSSFKPYDAVFVADASNYGTRYFVAVYGQKGPYKVTLDTNVDVEGETASIAEWAGGANMTDYEFGTQKLVDGAYVDTGEFALPAAARTGYTFEGWERYQVNAQGQTVLDGNGNPVVEETVAASALGTFRIDPYTVARNADAHAELAELAYHAKWTANEYTVVLNINRTDNGNTAAANQEITVRYNDTTPIRLPYPAAMGGGMCFTTYNVKANGRSSDDGILYAYDDAEGVSAATRAKAYTVKDIIARIVGEGLPEPTSRVDLYAQWNSTINVSMPVRVLIKVDPERGDIITSPLNIRNNGTFPSKATEVHETVAAELGTTGANSGTRDVEVVSLRYTKGPEDVFALNPADANAGAKAYLTVYAGQTGLDFRTDGNIDAATGRVKVGTGEDAELGYEPLKIDLSASDAVFPDFNTTAKLHGTYGFDSIRGASKTLPLHYSLLFQGSCANGNALSALYFRDITKTLKIEERDSDVTHEFAKVTYTIRQAG